MLKTFFIDVEKSYLKQFNIRQQHKTWKTKTTQAL